MLEEIQCVEVISSLAICSQIKRNDRICFCRRAKWLELQSQLDLLGDIQPKVMQNFKDVCHRFISIFGHPSQYPATTSEMTCSKCQSIVCPEICMNDREEIIVFDFGSKITYFKYASESTGQLSMHPTVGPLVIPPQEDLLAAGVSVREEMAINLSCPICSKMVKRRECDAEGSHIDKSHPKSPHAGHSRFANALSRLSLRNLHCFDTTHSVDDAVFLSDTDVPLTCILQKSQPIQVHSVTPDIGLPVVNDEGRKMDADLSSAQNEQFKVYTFLIRHMLKRNPFFQVQSIPFVMCEPIGCDFNMKVKLVEYLLCNLKVPGSVLLFYIPSACICASHSEQARLASIPQFDVVF